jgi:hypothetical protein
MRKLIYTLAVAMLFSINICKAQQDIVNGDFEFWDTIPGTNGWEDPIGWKSRNYVLYNCTTGVNTAGILRSSDAYSGSYSLKIAPTNSYSFNSQIAMVEGNCQYSNCLGPYCDDYPVTYNHEKIVGYYIFLPDSDETLTANISILQINYDSISGSPSTVRSGALWFSPAQSWTYFEVPIGYFTFPTIQGEFFKLGINLLSNNPTGNPQGYLLIDSLALVPEVVTGVEIRETHNLKFSPNPVHDKIIIESNIAFESFELCDLSGRIIKTGHFQKEMDVSYLSKGIYFMRLQSNEKMVVEKFVKE